MSYNKPKGFKGPRGTQLHDAIVDWTRFNLMPYIRTVFPDIEWDCIYDDGLQTYLLATKGDQSIGGTRRGVKVPDGLWIYDSDSIVIEVGRYLVNKWHSDQQVLHIGFDGQVNVVNAQDELTIDVAGAIRDYITELMALDPLSASVHLSIEQ